MLQTLKTYFGYDNFRPVSYTHLTQVEQKNIVRPILCHKYTKKGAILCSFLNVFHFLLTQFANQLLGRDKFLFTGLHAVSYTHLPFSAWISIRPLSCSISMNEGSMWHLSQYSLIIINSLCITRSPFLVHTLNFTEHLFLLFRQVRWQLHRIGHN